MITFEMMQNYLSHLHNKYNQNPEEYAPDFAGMGRVMIYDLDLAQVPSTWTTRAHFEHPCPQLRIRGNSLQVVDISPKTFPSGVQT